jgi:hypothetical protein
VGRALCRRGPSAAVRAARGEELLRRREGCAGIRIHAWRPAGEKARWRASEGRRGGPEGVVAGARKAGRGEGRPAAVAELQIFAGAGQRMTGVGRRRVGDARDRCKVQKARGG